MRGGERGTDQQKAEVVNLATASHRRQGEEGRGFAAEREPEKVEGDEEILKEPLSKYDSRIDRRRDV